VLGLWAQAVIEPTKRRSTRTWTICLVIVFKHTRQSCYWKKNQI